MTLIVPPTSNQPPATVYPDPIPDVVDFGTVNLLAGAPGVGKTTLFAEWCARWRDGRTICGRATNPPTGLAYLSTDRGGQSTQKLLDQHGLLDNSWTTYYNPLDDPDFDRGAMRNAHIALETLTYCLDRFRPAILPGSHLVIDPAAPLFVPGSSNDPRAIAAMLWELHIIARERQLTTFVLAHFSKQLADVTQRYQRPQDRISGSGAWSGFSDTQMYMVDPEPPGQPYHIVGWNPRHSEPAAFKLLRKGPVFIPYRSLQDVGARIRVPQTAYTLFELIPPAGIKTTQLVTDAQMILGVSQATIYRLLKKLEALTAIDHEYGYVKPVPIEQVECVPDGESEGRPH